MTDTIKKLMGLRNDLYRAHHGEFADRLQALIDEVKAQRDDVHVVISTVADELGYDSAMIMKWTGSTNDIDMLHDMAQKMFEEGYYDDQCF